MPKLQFVKTLTLESNYEDIDFEMRKYEGHDGLECKMLVEQELVMPMEYEKIHMKFMIHFQFILLEVEVLVDNRDICHHF